MTLAKRPGPLLALLIGIVANPAHAGGWTAMGIRAGSSDLLLNQDDGFSQVGVFATHSLPWQWRLASGRVIETGLNVELHHLDGRGNSAQLFSTGPQLEYRAGKWSVDGGFAVTYLSEAQFTGKDLGGQVMVVSHLGVRYDLTPAWAAGLRIQHMSNAGLDNPNPGLNQAALELLRRF